MPPGSPPGAVYHCPLCSTALTHISCAAAKEAHAAKSAAAQQKADVKHRNKHAGQYLFKQKLLHMDHHHRVPSLLHLILNATATTMAVILDAGSTLQQRLDMNLVLQKHGVLFRFKEKKAKGDRPKKAVGNDCRLLLWKAGLFPSLLAERWGAPTTAEEIEMANNIRTSQAQSEHLDPTTATSPPVVERNGCAPTIAGGPRRDVAQTAADDDELASLVADLLPPAPAPAPAPSPPAADDSGDCPDSDEDEIDEADDEVEDEDGDEAFLPVVGEIAGNHRTALRSFASLLMLMMDLHKDWFPPGTEDPDEDSMRPKHAKEAQMLGSQWARNIRAHATDSLGHYYMHLCAAHLEELILQNGNLQNGNDEILEAGNYTMKKYRDMSWRGSGACAVGKDTHFTRTMHKKVVDADGTVRYVAYTDRRKRNVGAEVAVLKMETAANLLQAQREHDAHAHTAKQEHAKAKRRKVKVDLKQEQADSTKKFLAVAEKFNYNGA